MVNGLNKKTSAQHDPKYILDNIEWLEKFGLYSKLNES
jgi:hypothetical protein